ncbi:MAG: DUF4157 domain-containing protein [Deltaproteobacteria bacterium]|nr:DUF4157 domain-containing protein [Deltaproteobacteria bacterium]
MAFMYKAPRKPVASPASPGASPWQRAARQRTAWQRSVLEGVSGPRSDLPYRDRLDPAMPSATSRVIPHTGPEARSACRDLGVEGFALGNHIAFDRSNPRLHVVAHELAHVDQHGSGSAETVRFYTESKIRNTKYRISDNLDMAVAQNPTSTVGSQVAYGYWDLVDRAAAKLDDLDSEVIMFTDPADRLPVGSPDLPVADLERIRIQPRSAVDDPDRQGLWPTDCRLAAHWVTGAIHTPERLRVRVGQGGAHAIDDSEHPAIQAARVYISLYPDEVDMKRFNEFVKAAKAAESRRDSEAYNASARAALDVAMEPYKMYSGDLAEEDAEAAGLDRHALPRLGEAYAILSAGQPIEDKLTWNYHFAGVIMTSGNDRMTLENYQAQVDLGDNWKLQMYGTREGQSFHEQHAATEGHGTTPTTAVFTRSGLPDDLE